MKTLKTCKSGCGKMKSGGKVKSIKRYDNGGTAGDPPVQNLSEVTIIGNKKTSKEKKMKDLFKRGRTTPVKDSSGGYKWSKGQKGMSVKTKYKDGGTIVGMPEYGNNPRTYSGAILKKGGIKKRAMGGDSNDRGMMDPNSGLKPTTYDPRTVVARKGGAYKKGGPAKNAKLAAVAPPKNKVTRADVLTRILKKKKK